MWKDFQQFSNKELSTLQSSEKIGNPKFQQNMSQECEEAKFKLRLYRMMTYVDTDVTIQYSASFRQPRHTTVARHVNQPTGPSFP